MVLGDHTLPADVEGVGSSSWADVFYFVFLVRRNFLTEVLVCLESRC
jgi:hypothetical protein